MELLPGDSCITDSKPSAAFQLPPHPPTSQRPHLLIYIYRPQLISDFLPFSLTRTENIVGFGAINVDTWSPCSAVHVVCEHLKVSGCVYGPGPPLFIVSVLSDTRVPAGPPPPRDSFLSPKRCMDANPQQGRTFTGIQQLSHYTEFAVFAFVRIDAIRHEGRWR